MSRLTRFAVARRSVTLLLASAFFIAGIAAWGSLKQELLPDVSFPVVSVIAPYPGAGASDVTEQVAKPIERAMSGVPGLTQLQTTSANSLAFAVAQFDYGTNLDEAVATIEENLRSTPLPDGVEPTVGSFDFNAAPVVVASVSAQGETSLDQAAEIARTELIPELLSLPGVASADLAGGLETRLEITLDPDKLSEAGVSVQQVTGILQANNLTLPGGQLSVDGEQIPVSTIGRFESVAQIEDLVVGVRMPTTPTTPDHPDHADDADHPHARRPTPPTPVVPQPITIGDLGSVELADVATTGYARTNGQPAVTISVSKTSAANTVAVAEAVQAKLDEIAARHPGEIAIVTIADQSSFILEFERGAAARGRSRGRLRRDHDLPVPGQRAIDLRRGGQHPALDPCSARDHAGRRDHPEHPDPRRPGGGGRTRGGRFDRRPREHLSPSGARARPDDLRHPGAARGRQRDHRQHVHHRCRVPATRVRGRVREPVLPVLLADRHVRPARIARRGIDGRPRPRVLPGQERQWRRGRDR